MGHSIFGFSIKEVGRMTVNYFYKIYSHYKNLHDFNLMNITYREFEEKQIKNEEWLPF